MAHCTKKAQICAKQAQLGPRYLALEACAALDITRMVENAQNCHAIAIGKVEQDIGRRRLRTLCEKHAPHQADALDFKTARPDIRL